MAEENALQESMLKEIAGDGVIEFNLYTPRNKTGVKTWELKIKNSDGSRKIIVVRDYGFNIARNEIKITPFKTRAERNAEISRLYNDEGLSQMFLSNFFNISQPSVSLIVNGKG